MPAICVAEAARPSEVAVAKIDVATADAEASSLSDAPSFTSAQMLEAREVTLLFSSEEQELDRIQKPALWMNWSLPSPQMQLKSVIVQLAAEAPVVKQSRAQVGNSATRLARSVELVELDWAAATAAKRGTAR